MRHDPRGFYELFQRKHALPPPDTVWMERVGEHAPVAVGFHDLRQSRNSMMFGNLDVHEAPQAGSSQQRIGLINLFLV